MALLAVPKCDFLLKIDKIKTLHLSKTDKWFIVKTISLPSNEGNHTLIGNHYFIPGRKTWDRLCVDADQHRKRLLCWGMQARYQ